MSQETDKDRYTTADMLEAARRLRAPGVSQRTGKKLKRRSVQPSKERDQFVRILLLLGFFVAAVVVGFASWYLTRLQDPGSPKDGGPALIPTAPSGR